MKKHHLLIILGLFVFTQIQSQSWVQQTTNVTEALYSINFVDDLNGYAVAYNGVILKTTNGGTTWNKIYDKNFTNFNSVQFLNSNIGFAVGKGGAIIKTTDGFSTFNYYYSSTYKNLEKIFMLDQTTGFVVGGAVQPASSEMRKTSDGGTTWNLVTGLPALKLWGIYFVNQNNGWAIGENGTIIRTSDGGTNWSAQTSNVNNSLRSVYFIDVNNGYAVGAIGTILKTTNGGANWTKLTSNTLNDLYAIHFVDVNNGYAVGYNGTIIKTTDGGTSWNPMTINKTNAIYSINFPASNLGFVSGEQGLIMTLNLGGTPCTKPSIVSQPTSLSKCPNDNISFSITASGTTPITYQWKKNNTIISNAVSSTLNLNSISANDVGNYYCLATNSCGKDSSNTANLAIGVLPVANAGNDVTICKGETSNLSASGGVSYTWTPNNGLSSPSNNNPLAYPSITTTYTVNVANSCGTATDIVVVNVSTPIANAGNDQTINTGSSANLTATGGNTYKWNNNATTANINVNPTVNTTYTVTVKDNFNCSASDDVVVYIAGSVIISAGKDRTICKGDTAWLWATGGNSYTWTPSTSLSNANIFNPIASPTITTTYTVTVKDAGGSIIGTDDQIVTVNQLPTTDAGANQTINSGSSANLTAIGGIVYKWSNNATTASITVNPTTKTTYYVSVTDINGCSASDFAIIDVNATSNNLNPPTFVNNCGNTVLTKVETSTYTAANGWIYYWQGANCGTFTTNSSNTYSVTTSGVYYIKALRTYTCGSTTCTSWSPNCGSVAVTVLSVPDPTSITKSTDNNCVTTLTPMPNIPACGTYYWQTSCAGTSLSNSAFTITAKTSGTYYVRTNSGSAWSNSCASIVVNVQNVVADAGADKSICFNQTTANLSTSGSGTYMWTPATGLSAINIANPVASPSVTTTYTISVYAFGCTATDNVIVYVNPLPTTPVVTATGNDVVSTQANAYQWYFNSNIIPNAIAQKYNPSQSGNYFIKVTDTNGCTTQSQPIYFNYVSIAENVNTDILKIYPNPNKGTFAINYKSSANQAVSITLADIKGRVVYNETFKLNNSTLTKEIGTNLNLSKGVYMLKTVSESKIFINHIVVE